MNLPLKNIDEIVTFSHGITFGVGNEEHTPAAQIKVKGVLWYNNEWHYEDTLGAPVKYPESAMILS